MAIKKNKAVAKTKLSALFVSDIHLQPELVRTTDFFLKFLEQQAKKADQLYLLGDLFEYWPGDDDMMTPYHQNIIKAIRAVSDAGTKVFWIAGNRDFLVGDEFARATGAQLLPDPSIINIAGESVIITHGDAQCTDDVEYMAFRTMVRQEKWQSDFLRQPLSKRKTVIESLRINSMLRQKEKTADIMDVNRDEIYNLFTRNKVKKIIHGHTHRPARHEYQEGLRIVLPDWECESKTEVLRGGWLAIYDDGAITSYRYDGIVIKETVKDSV